MWSFFKYRKGPNNLGIGTQNLGLEMPQDIPPPSIYGRRYNVRGTLAPTAPGYAVIGQRVVPVSLLGNTGIALQGQFALQALAEMERGR